MIRSGELCASCKGGKCNASPQEHGEIEIECVTCSGIGCANCNNGVITIDRCPKELIDTTTLEIIRLCEARKDGILPIAGGLLDQSSTAITAMELFSDDMAKIEAEQYVRKH